MKTSILFLALMAFSSAANSQTWTDITSDCVQNPDYATNYEGWDVTLVHRETVGWTSHCFRFYSSSGSIEQTVNVPQAGTYRISLNAFMRPGSFSNEAVQAHADGTEVIPGYIYANDVQQPLLSIFSEYSETQLNGSNWMDSEGHYYPNNSSAAWEMLGRGHYLNELTVTVGSECQLTIGVNTGDHISDSWLVMTNWKVEFQGETQPVNPDQLTWVDITELYVQNPNFDEDKKIKGWTDTFDSSSASNHGYIGTSYDNGDVHISHFAEAWRNQSGGWFYGTPTTLGDGSIYQLVENLPTGRFKMEVDAIAVDQNQGNNPVTGALLFMNDGTDDFTLEMATNNEKPKHFSLETEESTAGQLTIGVRTESTTANWMAFDNVRLWWKGNEVKATKITVSPTTAALLPSEEVQLTATISPANTSFKKLAWSSSDENVATVDENGLVTAHSGGTATITVRQAVGSSTVSGTCVITVKQTNIQPGQLIANEVQVANIDMFIDPSWNFGGWVELFNKTDEALSLDGLYVSDDPANPLKQRLDSRFGIVPAHGFINLWFDHHSRWAPAMVAFKLDPDGGTFLLSKADGTTLIHLDYPPAISRTSYARTTDDGDTWNYTDQPTPEASNATSTFATSQLAAPVVDKKGGLFTGHITVTVNIPTRTTLRYTLDGSTPTLTNGEVSRDGRFDFDATAILRVRLFQNGMLASPVVTRSFIYQDKNYTLPVLSLVSDDANLYGSAYGIFVKGSGNGRAGNGQDDKCNWNMDWDRPANIEFYPEDGTAGFNQETSVESSGGWSRAWTPHSFNIKANKVYEGLNRMEYQFFPNKPFLNHKALKVRNGGNDNGDRIKDAAIQQVVTTSGLYVETQSYRPVHIFHNGKYIGVENLREPNNKHYALANYGIDTDDEDMDQWKMSPDSGYVQQVGDAVAWKELLELSESADEALTYEQIKERIDIEEYCNYLSVMFYVGCTDWPQNNIKAFRSRTEGESNSRFRFVIFDTDHSFNTTTSAFTTFDGKQWYTFDPLRGKEIIAEYGSRIYEEIEFVTLFKNLIQNEEFCKQFVDQFCLVAGSVFEPNRSREIIQAMLDHVNPAMQLEGRSASSSANSVMNNLSSDRQSRMIRALRDYLGLSYDDQLYVSLESNLDEATLRVNGLEVPTGKFGGTLFAPITITASAPAGYRFTGWENDGYLFSSDPTLELDESLDLVATFEPLKGKELAASDAHPVKINEVSATNDIYVSDLFKKSDWIELYNTTDNDYDLAGMYLTDHAHLPQRFQFPASTNKISTVIPAHGHLVVWCDDKEAVGQIHTGFKLENNDTCYVILTAADKSWADTLAYCRHDGFHTVGLYPDGGSELYVMERPTIGATNTLTTHAVAWEEPTIGQTVGINVSDLAVVDDLQLTYANRNLRLHTTAAAARIDVFNAAGNLVQTSRAVNGANVSLTALPAGIYIARASTDDNQTTLKFTLR